MNSTEFKNTICRICLDEDVILDWNNVLFEYGDITYKDCYYKYTQINRLDADPFSSMLCLNCSNGLENIHTIILKAHDSYKFLLSCISSETDDSIVEDNENYESTDFETVLVEKTDTESEIQEEFENENFDYFLKNSQEIKEDETEEATLVEMEFREVFEIESNNEDCDIEQALQLDLTKDTVSQSMNSVTKKSKRITANKSKLQNQYVDYEESNIKEKFKTAPQTSLRKKKAENDELESTSVKNTNRDLKTAKKRKKGTKYVQQHTPSMCSFCSKILHSKYALQKHEKIHIANRERKETCPICGVKFFTQHNLKLHMQIHNENRVKKHKCEFCGKAFYERGVLNVHRRIHLGQMIPCSLCSKEFYRQIDLDIHMNSHSTSSANGSTKKRSRYCVRCKYCNKNIMSTSFKSHTAAHLNEPLMKCSICNKEFFRRDSCRQHLRLVHGKTAEEYNDLIVVYNKNRLSHLYLEQTADILVNEE